MSEDPCDSEFLDLREGKPSLVSSWSILSSRTSYSSSSSRLISLGILLPLSGFAPVLPDLLVLHLGVSVTSNWRGCCKSPTVFVSSSWSDIWGAGWLNLFSELRRRLSGLPCDVEGSASSLSTLLHFRRPLKRRIYTELGCLNQTCSRRNYLQNDTVQVPTFRKIMVSAIKTKILVAFFPLIFKHKLHKIMFQIIIPCFL